MARTLDTLPPGEQGRVAALDFPPAMLRRLRELGFLPGGVITALHPAGRGRPTYYAAIKATLHKG